MYGMELMGLLREITHRAGHRVACPCCHGAGVLLLYSAEQEGVSERVGCCHCSGTGEVAAEVTATPMKLRRSWREWWWFT